MKFWLAFGARSVNRSTSMSPRSVAMVALVMGPPGSWLASRSRAGHRDLGHGDGMAGDLVVGRCRDRVDGIHAGRDGAEDGVGVRARERARGAVVQDDEELRAL